jgi:basic amino acid/polyamine antiporter, APA family
VFALALPLVTLAKLTSFIVLTVFVLVNLSLIRIKRRAPAPAGVTRYPPWIPWGGMVLSLLLLAFQASDALR